LSTGYGHSVWCPHSVTAIESLEKVQKRATKLIHGFEKSSYSERLRKCELPTLKYRRIRGDITETYKIITGIYDREASPVVKLNLSTITRGNRYKLDTHRTKYDLRKYFFTNRIVYVWNSLPDTVVMSETVNQLKNRLDKFWSNQDIIYNYKAE